MTLKVIQGRVARECGITRAHACARDSCVLVTGTSIGIRVFKNPHIFKFINSLFSTFQTKFIIRKLSNITSNTTNTARITIITVYQTVLSTNHLELTEPWELTIKNTSFVYKLNKGLNWNRRFAIA